MSSFVWRSTQAGRDAIAVAIATGPKLENLAFKLGSGVGYAPTNLETALHGAVLHTQTVNNIEVTSANRARFHVVVNQLVGDFLFGEAGIYLPSGELAFIGVLSELQPKRAITPSTIGDILDLKIEIEETNLGASINVVISSTTNAQLATVLSVDALVPPNASGSNAYLTYSLDSGGSQILAMRYDDHTWKFPAFRQLLAGATTAGTAPGLLRSSALIAGSLPGVATGKYIVQITSGANRGYCRMVTGFTAPDIFWGTALPNPVESGATFIVWSGFASELDNHVAHADPHPQYLLATEIPTLAYATETAQGVVELATSAESGLWGTALDTVLTPRNLPSGFVANRFLSNQDGVASWQRLPGNLVLMWCRDTVSQGGANVVSKNVLTPIQFDTPPLMVTGSVGRSANGGWNAAIVLFRNRSSAGFQMVLDSTDPSVNIDSNMPVDWFLIGYKETWDLVPGVFSLSVGSATYEALSGSPQDVGLAGLSHGGTPGQLLVNIVSGNLPSGLSVGVVGLTLRLTGTSTDLGNYPLTLRVINAAMGQSALFSLNLSVVNILGSSPPVADFNATITGGTDLAVTDFNNLSLGGNTFVWNFGGAATPNTSTDVNPVGIAFPVGSHTVTLVATNSNGSDTETKADYIVVVDSPGSGGGA